MQERRVGRRVRAAVMTATIATGALLVMPPASHGATSTVRATSSRAWSPKSISVARGTKVTWRNPTGDDHNVVAYGGGWSKRAALDEGRSTSFVFKRAGRFRYRCTLHSKLSGTTCSGMCGQVRAK